MAAYACHCMQNPLPLRAARLRLRGMPKWWPQETLSHTLTHTGEKPYALLMLLARYELVTGVDTTRQSTKLCGRGVVFHKNILEGVLN